MTTVLAASRPRSTSSVASRHTADRRHTTDFSYDIAGRLLETNKYQQFETSSNTLITAKNTYDSLGRLVTEEDANLNTTTYVYDDLNRVIETQVLDNGSTTAPPIFLSTTEYDANGDIARMAVYDVVGLLTTGGLSSIPALHADVLNLITSKPAYVQVVKAAYDAFGRPVEVTNADDTTTSTIYDAAGRVRYTFDELGRKTEQRYDQFGRLERFSTRSGRPRPRRESEGGV